MRLSVSAAPGSRALGRAGALLLACHAFFASAVAAQSPPSASSFRLPKAISAADKASVELALNYLSRGADSWASSLASSNRFAGLTREELLGEIEARTGPSTGAVWQLLTTVPDDAVGKAVFRIDFPSGVDTHVVIDLAPQGSGWLISDVRSFAEPAPEDVEDVRPPPGRSPEQRSNMSAVTIVVLSVGGALALAGLLMRRRGFRLALGLMAIGGVAIAFSLWGMLRDGGVRQSPPPAQAPAPKTLPSGEGRMAGLRSARKILSTADKAAVQEALAALPTSGTAGEVGRVWKAEWALHERDLAAASQALASFPGASRIPEVGVLRGRLAFLRNQPRQVVEGYESAAHLGADQDALRLEAAQFLGLLSDDETAAIYVAQAAHAGSRLAEASYLQSARDVHEQHGVDAEKWFLQAWRLRPVPREALLHESFFWDLLRRPALYAQLKMDSSEEPVVLAGGAASTPIVLPSGAEARLCGAHLQIRVGSSRLEIPGGASLAPSGTPSDDAGAWTRREEQEALARVQSSSGAAQSAAALDPMRRKEIETAATGLARVHRWADVTRLTEDSSDLVDRFGGEFVLLRAEALRRTDQPILCKALLHRAAESEPFVKRSGPGTLFELALALASFGDFDLAIQIAEKAKTKLHSPGGNWLLERLKLEKKLSESFTDYSTEHFLIRYPRAHPQSGTRKLGVILNGERERLTKWIPLRSFAKTEVHLLWFEDFERTYFGDVGLVGVFDGRIRLPFAGGDDLDFSLPEIVSIVTHELAHAMISELTLDSAPHWFQEGLAQHVEMRPEHFNPIPLYESQSRFLSLPVIEGVLEGLPAPDLAEAAYQESLWMVHYLEDTGGTKAIAHLLKDFRAGASTEEALRGISYDSVSDFETRFRAWSHLATSRAWSRPILHYLGNRGTEAHVPGSLRDSMQRVLPDAEEPPPEITPDHHR